MMLTSDHITFLSFIPFRPVHDLALTERICVLSCVVDRKIFITENFFALRFSFGILFDL